MKREKPTTHSEKVDHVSPSVVSLTTELIRAGETHEFVYSEGSSVFTAALIKSWLIFNLCILCLNYSLRSLYIIASSVDVCELAKPPL